MGNGLAAATRELLGLNDLAQMRAAMPGLVLRHYGVAGTAVVAEAPAGQPALPLDEGWWLTTPTLAGAELSDFAGVAAAALAAAARAERTVRDYSAVMGRLDQLHRDLDAAQRNEWVASERTRIAQDLHDRVAQTLFGIGLKADWLLTHLDQDAHLRADLERVKQMAGQGLRQVREAIFSLSSAPVDAKQFKAAVQGLLTELAGAGITGDLRTWGDVQRMPQEVVDALYQVIREALVNVRRHAGASTVLVSLRVGKDKATAVIQDDGRGLPPVVQETFRESGAHLGLRGMESRVRRMGGALSLAPGDECGLVVTAHIPLKGGAVHE